MLQNWFILLPEICMLSFFLVAWCVNSFRQEKTSKTFFSLAQVFLLASMACSVLFYNKSAFPLIWQNTSFNTLFKSFAGLLAWAWFYLSSKWFLNKNRPSFKFYTICFALLFCFDILASSSSFLTLCVVFPLISLFYYLLVLQHWDTSRVEKTARLYLLCAVIFTLLLWGGTAILYHFSGAFDYASVKAFFSRPEFRRPEILAAVLMVIASFMFMMALVPFHNWFIGFVSSAVLPVCGFITLVPPLIYICAFMNLMSLGLQPFVTFAAPVLGIFAFLSVIVGALSANGEKNIRRLFAFLSVYCFGTALIGLFAFSDKAQIASFAYIVIALLSFAGIYTVFLGMKSKGEYLSDVADIGGLYHNRPYMSAALLVFMFSLIGLAPTLGFFGYLSIVNNLVSGGEWGAAVLLFISLLFVAGACLQIVRTVYFEPPANKFDRTDKAIYICLFINMLLILISLLNPAWLIHDALVILGGIA